jgi:hypothetical protein
MNPDSKGFVIIIASTRNQCFGSGSMWIRIEMAPLDSDQYREYGYRTVKMVFKKEKI